MIVGIKRAIMVLENELEFCNESEEYLIEDLIEKLKEEVQKIKTDKNANKTIIFLIRFRRIKYANRHK